MINFDNIENSLRREIADDNGDVSCDLTNTALLELITRLRQAEKDAARYRWLRDEAHFKRDNSPLAFFTDANGHWMEFDFDGSSYSILYDKVLDAAIDEAMQCK